MARRKIHLNEAARKRASRLRRRSAAIKGYFASVALVRLYEKKGWDVSTTLQLPWLKVDEVFAEVQAFDELTLFNQLLEMPYVDIDKSSHRSGPLVRIACLNHAKPKADDVFPLAQASA